MKKISLFFSSLVLENGEFKQLFFDKFSVPLSKGDLSYHILESKLEEKADSLWGAGNWRKVVNKSKSLSRLGSFYCVSTAEETEGDTLQVSFPSLNIVNIE